VPLDLILAAIALAAASGLPALALPRKGDRASGAGQRASTALLAAACAAGLAGAALGLGAPASPNVYMAWPAVGDGLVGLDALASFFLVPVFLVGGLAAVYALGYHPQSRNPRTARSTQAFLGLLVAGMALLVVARHALSFLLGWEAMALSAFFLVGAESGKAEARRASLVYLLATHAGTLALFCLFALWRSATGSFELAAAAGLGPGAALGVFVLALVAFGLKAGMMPLHFWLPGAHAAAPSHVSALLSGVVLKMGVYGLVRITSLLPAFPASWGGITLFLGCASALLGVAFAIAQHDLKRLLAYHSVENVGIILMGLGLAMAGRSLGRPELVALGLGGCLLHTWNHALFKSLLFLGAGSVVRATGTRRIDRLGGLASGMPATAALFVVGAVAICGLPPLNGFVSELCVYLGLFGAVAGGAAAVTGPLSVSAALAAVALAMVGALAVACFVKVSGAVFLGEPRSPSAERAREAPASMLVPMAILALACAAIGLAPALVAPAIDAATAVWVEAVALNVPSIAAAAPLGAVGLASAAIAVAAVAALLVLSRLNRARNPAARNPAAREDASVKAPPTWDCGYARPTSRMQYSSSSFARSIVGMFAWAIKPPAEPGRLEGYFPKGARLHGEPGDAVLDRALLPAFKRIEALSLWMRRFQQGLTQQYVLYVAIALVVLLATLVPFGELLALLGIA
jgi:hydrogenase-4 component B